MSRRTVELEQLRPRGVGSEADREQLQGRARRLAWGGNAWHLVEFAIAVGAGIAAGSVALVGFGIDSVIEALAGGVVVWLFSGGRGSSHSAERRATPTARPCPSGFASSSRSTPARP